MSLNVPKKAEKMSPNVPKDSLTEREKRIVELILVNNSVTTKEIAKKLEVAEKTIKRDISDLKAKQIVERVGGKNGGHWEIIHHPSLS